MAVTCPLLLPRGIQCSTGREQIFWIFDFLRNKSVQYVIYDNEVRSG